jgi:predicted Zn-dependent peptidase
VYSYHSMFAETGLFAAYAGTTPSRAQEVLGIMRDQMADIAAGGLTAEELDRAKGHMKGSLVLSLEDTSGRMSRIGKSEISQGEILSVDELIGRIDAVTGQEAQAAAALVFGQPMALAVVGPFGSKAFQEVRRGGAPAEALAMAAHASDGPR